MQKFYWTSKWQKNDIKFHQEKGCEYFDLFVEKFIQEQKSSPSIFFPLCGKSLDMLKAQKLGCNVEGVEFSQLAVENFFRENKLTVKESNHQCSLKKFESEGLVLWCGDFFSFNQNSSFDLIFDRAAIVAISPENRDEYAKRLTTLLKPNGTIFLIGIEHDLTNSGPPFSLSKKQIISLFSQHDVELVFEKDSLEQNPHLQRKGMRSMVEFICKISK